MDVTAPRAARVRTQTCATEGILATYAYRAAKASGRILRGREEAVSQAALEQEIHRRGLMPLEISAIPTAEERRTSHFVSRRTDVTEFITTFAALLRAGLSLDRSLEIAGRGVARSDVARAIYEARQHVKEGGRFADALASRPELFSPVAVGLMRAAEGGGRLPEAAERLSAYMERQKALRAKITSAMIYPLLLCTAAASAIAILLLFVLPRFAALLAEAGSALPRSTAVLIGLSTAVTRGFPLLVAGMFTLLIATLAWQSTPDGRIQAHAFLLRVPIIGYLRARHSAARFGHTVATLLAGGVPLIQALDVAQDTAGDAAVSSEIRSARDAVRRGDSFSAALGRGRAFPYAFLRLIEVGEETGELDSVLDRAAALLEGELERRVDRLVALVEPVLIIVFGAAVGFVALALLQAVYGLRAQGL